MIYTHFSKKTVIKLPDQIHIIRPTRPKTLVLFSRQPVSKNISLLIKKKKIWDRRYASFGFFRSFFGFLKPNSFIVASKFNLLTSLRINPKPFSLSQIISQTKKYTAPQIATFFESTTVQTRKYTSVSFLKKSVQKVLPKITQQSSFKLFRHKIFNYTTPKTLRPTFPTTSNVSYSYSDARTGYILRAYLSPSLLNSQTVSTFNWKNIT